MSEDAPVLFAQHDQAPRRRDRDDVRGVRRHDRAARRAVIGEQTREHPALQVGVKVRLGLLDRDQRVLDLALSEKALELELEQRDVEYVQRAEAGA